MPAASSTNILKQIGFDQKLNAQVPLDLPFVDEEGRAVHLGDYFGKRPVVLALVYYDCPMLCTQVMNGAVASLQGAVARAGQGLRLRDHQLRSARRAGAGAGRRPHYVEAIMAAHGDAAEGWHFLTGKQPAIKRADEGGRLPLRVGRSQIKQFAHPTGHHGLTPTGHVARYLFGIEYCAARSSVRAGRGVARQGRDAGRSAAARTVSTTTPRPGATASSIDAAAPHGRRGHGSRASARSSSSCGGMERRGSHRTDPGSPGRIRGIRQEALSSDDVVRHPALPRGRLDDARRASMRCTSSLSGSRLLLGADRRADPVLRRQVPPAVARRDRHADPRRPGAGDRPGRSSRSIITMVIFVWSAKHLLPRSRRRRATR